MSEQTGKVIVSPLVSLLHSRKVMVALLALLIVVAKVIFPSIPDEVVKAFEVFALAIITAITIEDFATKV